MNLKTKVIVDKFIIFSIIIICFSIFLPPFFKSISITLLIFSILGAFFTKTYTPKLNLNKDFLLLFFFFFLHIIGIFYSSNKDFAFFDIQVKMPMLILPIIFLFIPKNFLSKDKLLTYSLAIIIGLVLTIFYCFILGIIRAINNSTPLISEIFYTKLSAGFHPSYLSLFAVVVLILTYKIPLNKFINATKSNLIKIAIIALISVFLVMLNSRAGLLILIIAYLWILFDMFFIKKSRLYAIITFIIILVSALFIINSEFLSMRYSNAIEDFSKNDNIKHETSSVSQRAFIYSNAWNLVSDNLVFGVGTGDVKSTLEELYKKENIHFYSYLNAHNQYLQTTIALGLLGLLNLVLVFLFPMIKMLKKKEYFLLITFILIGFSFLFESMLERSMGVYFFSLIYVLSNSYLDMDKL